MTKTMAIYLIIFGLLFIVFGLLGVYAMQYKVEEWGLNPEGIAIPWVFFGVGMFIVIVGMWVKGLLGRQDRVLFIFFNYCPVLFILGGLGALAAGSLMLINGTEGLGNALLLIFMGLGFVYIPIRVWKSWNWRFFNDINDLRKFLRWDIPERPGRSALLKNEGIADCLYAPTRKHTKTEAQFLTEVARFGGDAMDKIGQDEEINQINIWVERKIPWKKGSRKRIWKGVKLVLDKSNWRGPVIGDLSSLAYHDQEQYLRLCSLQHIDKNEFPKWPKHEWGGPG